MKTRKQYVSAMIYAIELSRKDTWTGRKSTSANGLRGIRKFERVNEIDFNPFDSSHLMKIEGAGSHEDFLRRAKRITETQYPRCFIV